MSTASTDSLRAFGTSGSEGLVSARPPRRSEERRRRRALVALARRRLRRETGARLGTLAAILVALAFAVVAIAVRIADGVDASLGGIVDNAARWIAWLAGGSVALVA